MSDFIVDLTVPNESFPWRAAFLSSVSESQSPLTELNIKAKEDAMPCLGHAALTAFVLSHSRMFHTQVTASCTFW